MTELVGRKLGKYEIQDCIGAGGMADVYKGYHPTLGRSVAIKVLKLEQSADPAFVESFVNEARTAAQLSHPHIVTIYDVGEQDGIHYIVMEHVSGQNLQQLIRTQGRLPPKRACELFDQIADALNHAHSRGFVHCDVKPSNILLDADGQVKLTDFGIARAVAQTTEEGERKKLVGSPRYMSPEHVQRKPLDHRSDIYALGVVLFEMLTGRVPFDEGDSSRIMYAHVSQRPPLPSSVNQWLPKEVDGVVLRALAKNPEVRYQNALQMAKDLRRVLLPVVGKAIPSRPEPSDELVPPPPARRLPFDLAQFKLWALLGLAAVVVLAAVAVLFKRPSGSGGRTTATSTPAAIVRAPSTSTPTARVGETIFPTLTPTPPLGPTSTLVPATATPEHTPTPTGPLRITSANAGHVVLQRTLKGHAGWIGSVVFSPDGGTLASASGDKTVRLWRVRDGALLRTLEGHTGEVYSVAFSPDGAILASGAMDHTVRLWRTSDGASQCTLQVGEHAWSRILAFDPSGRFVAGDSAEVARVWEVATCGLAKIIQGEAGTCVAFSPDGKLLASGSQWRGEVRIVQMSDGALLRTLSGHTDAVWALAFSADGKTLASGAGAEIRLWRVADGALLSTLRGHENSVDTLAFSPDGGILASGSHDSTVRLWRVADGKLLSTLKGHSREVNGVTFSPDGKTLASGSGDGTVRLWGVQSY